MDAIHRKSQAKQTANKERKERKYYPRFAGTGRDWKELSELGLGVASRRCRFPPCSPGACKGLVCCLLRAMLEFCGRGGNPAVCSFPRESILWEHVSVGHSAVWRHCGLKQV